jgi:predicted DNA-binding protein with PD1-like motif
MRTKVLHEDGGLRHVAVVLDKDDEAISMLRAAAQTLGISAASFTAIGAFREVTLGWFDGERQDYERIHLAEQVEVVSLVGDVALTVGDDAKIHAHVVVGQRDGTALGGHLLDGHVWPTLEVVLTETPADMRRVHDPETGLALIDLGAD